MGGIRRKKKKKKKQQLSKIHDENGESGVKGRKNQNNEKYLNNNKDKGGGSDEGTEMERLKERRTNKKKKKNKKERHGSDKKKKYKEELQKKKDEAELKENIEKIFDAGDLNSGKKTIKFNREWRMVMGYECARLPFSTLLSAFHQRYAITSFAEGEDESEGDDEGEGDEEGEDESEGDDEGEGDEEGEDESEGEGEGEGEVEGEGESEDEGQGEGEGEEGGGGTLTRVECIESLTLTDKEEGGEAGNIPHLDCHSMEEILVRLPIVSLMRAKTVCKSWNTTIGELWNVEGHHLAAHHIAQGYHGIVFFSSPLNRWFRIPIQWPWKLNGSHIPTGLTLGAAGGGLFLLVRDMTLKYFVFNPLTKQHRVLPAFPMMLGWSSGLALELITESDHFKVITIVWSCERPFKVSPLIYNSCTDKWTTISITGPSPPSFSNSDLWISTLLNGVVYCTNSYGLNLGCYNIDSGEFEFMEIEGGLPPLVDCLDSVKNHHATLPSLVACNGKLILVGRLQRRTGQQSILGRFPLIKHNLVGLWELDTKAKSKSWFLISETPRNLLEDTVKSSDGTDFRVCASQGMDQIWFILKGSMNMLSFNLSSMEWSLLPGFPSEDMMGSTTRSLFSAPLRISSCF